MCRVAAAGVYHIFHIQRVSVFVHQFMRTEKLQRLAALLTFMRHCFIADIGRCFFADQTDSTQLLFPPFATHLPQFSIPPVGAKHTCQRTRYEFIGHRFAAVSFPTKFLKRRRDNIQTQGFRSHLFPCLADFFWLNVIGGVQITTSGLKTHAHMRCYQGGQAFHLILAHFRQDQQPLQPLMACHKTERNR